MKPSNSLIARLKLLLVFFTIIIGFAFSTQTHAAPTDAPLAIGNRTIIVFRGNYGLFSPIERANNAKQRIATIFPLSKEGWTSIQPTSNGIAVSIDGKPIFYVLKSDLPPNTNQTVETLANEASRNLQSAWEESKETKDPSALANAWINTIGATVGLIVSIIVLNKLLMRFRTFAVLTLTHKLREVHRFQFGRKLTSTIAIILARLIVLMAWLISLGIVALYLTFVLNQFVLTRPAAETLIASITGLVVDGATGFVSALPGLFLAALIFLAAWMATRLSTELFNNVEKNEADHGPLNAHTAPTTRRIVNASLWLFAAAMAYPYLPGAHTQAFQGLSVLLGLMVSIGASGVVGQIASGVMIVYTYALKKGEYVKIAEHEGTVTELGLFVTRLRTGMGEEVALPNTFVLANVTRNFSRIHSGTGFVLDVAISIGYDTSWRLVHEMLLTAAKSVPDILNEPPAYVVQTALSDFYVEYKLVTHVGTEEPSMRARVASALRAAIQDEFNRNQVQIMSPHYFADPATPKIVTEIK
ncbi:mechanosensitive ion channel [Leeia sp. TBRC 13508]|uniref:Small-conductance mechanosensitive channel n=1 Tax=Leeia speluncae TaxID=2884804 RepID=A0ABS8D770_9NEIS|nr:mechanosensitive ion channel domain-containing protein [Leeia speluncae]MCB6184027.1 mechanosensitive ion channel [Leeia speluncae]